jgi:hypothetical protein
MKIVPMLLASPGQCSLQWQPAITIERAWAQPDAVKGNVPVPSASTTYRSWLDSAPSPRPRHHGDHITANDIEDVIVQRALLHLEHRRRGRCRTTHLEPIQQRYPRLIS